MSFRGSRFSADSNAYEPVRRAPQVVASPQSADATESAGPRPFNGDWYVCYVAKILEDFSLSGAPPSTASEGPSSSVWSPRFHSWLLHHHSGCIIRTDRYGNVSRIFCMVTMSMMSCAWCDRPISLRDYIFRYDRGAFWMGFMSLPCLCHLAHLGVPCIDGLNGQDTRLRSWIGYGHANEGALHSSCSSNTLLSCASQIASIHQEFISVLAFGAERSSTSRSSDS